MKLRKKKDEPMELTTPWYLVTPAGDGPLPGIVVIHEGNGMSPQLLRFCERLAREGYVTIAPDMFWRAGGPEAGDFGTLMGALEPARMSHDVGAAVDELRRLGCPKIGMTGFCMGGGIAYLTAVDGPEVACAAAFYGGGIAQRLDSPRCPVVLFFGGTDPYIPPADIAAVQNAFPAETIVYPDAGHGFMRDGSDDHHAPSATDAWERLTAFFAAHLR